MYRHILTRKEADLIQALGAHPSLAPLEIASATKLTPSEIGILVDGLRRRGIVEQSEDSSRIKLTATGSEVLSQLGTKSFAGAKPSPDVLVTDDASAERMMKNLQSTKLDTDLENYIDNLKI